MDDHKLAFRSHIYYGGYGFKMEISNLDWIWTNAN